MTDKTLDTVRVEKPRCPYCGARIETVHLPDRVWNRTYDRCDEHHHIVPQAQANTRSIPAALQTLEAVPEPTPEMEELAREILIKCNKRRAQFGIRYA